MHIDAGVTIELEWCLHVALKSVTSEAPLHQVEWFCIT
ncbi:hypothetical protein JCM19233_5365 [Vibrio astriarenae]|nr:hypothetical protein JCM19233_5365 [Vibrio sp. C7]